MLPYRTPGPHLQDGQPNETTLPSSGLGESGPQIWRPLRVRVWWPPWTAANNSSKSTASSWAPPAASHCRRGTGCGSAWGQCVRPHSRSPVLSKSALWISIHTSWWFFVAFCFPQLFFEKIFLLQKKHVSKMITHSKEALRPGRATWAANLMLEERGEQMPSGQRHRAPAQRGWCGRGGQGLLLSGCAQSHYRHTVSPSPSKRVNRPGC